MNVLRHLREIATAPYYRSRPAEALRYTYAKWLFNKHRVGSPIVYLERLGIDPSSALAGFDRWQPLLEAMLQAVRKRDGMQGGISLEDGTILYALTRTCRPEHVIETGVAAGVSNSFISAALIENDTGTLHSIELPPAAISGRRLGDGLAYQWTETGLGWAVPPEITSRMGDRRRLLLGDVREQLPKLLNMLPCVDLFFHDDLHTPDHMLWEFELVWPYLRPGGIIVSDDVGFGWVRFCRNHGFGSDALLNVQRLATVRKPEP